MVFVVVGLCRQAKLGIAPFVFPSLFIVAFIIVRNFSELY